MNIFDIFNLNDLKKAFKKIKSLIVDNHYSFNENDLVQIKLHIQQINPIGPFYFYTLDDNIKFNINEEDYNGMLYTAKIILMEIYKLIKDNLNIILICNPITAIDNIDYKQFFLQESDFFLAKIIRLLVVIKELQQELHIKPDNLFFQIDEPYDINSLETTILLLQNENLSELKITGGLIFQAAIISQFTAIAKEDCVEKLLSTKIFNKVNNVRINFINYNNYYSLYGTDYHKNKGAIILAKEKNQLLNLFDIIKNLINKHTNIIKCDIYFGKYNLISNYSDILKTLNILPKEYYNLRQIYNCSVQNSILNNIKNKLEKYLFKIYSLENSIQNLQHVSKQENIINDDFLNIKLRRDIYKIENLQKESIENFINYYKILIKTKDPSVLDYLNKFNELNNKYAIVPKYLGSKNQISILFNLHVAYTNLTNLNKCHNDFTSDVPGMIIEYSESGKVMFFSGYNFGNYSHTKSVVQNAPANGNTNSSITNITNQPKLSLTI